MVDSRERNQENGELMVETRPYKLIQVNRSQAERFFHTLYKILVERIMILVNKFAIMLRFSIKMGWLI